MAHGGQQPRQGACWGGATASVILRRVPSVACWFAAAAAVGAGLRRLGQCPLLSFAPCRRPCHLSWWLPAASPKQELKAKEQIAQLKLEISSLTKLLEQVPACLGECGGWVAKRGHASSSRWQVGQLLPLSRDGAMGLVTAISGPAPALTSLQWGWQRRRLSNPTLLPALPACLFYITLPRALQWGWPRTQTSRS